ncbi:cytoskeleton-associated protein 2 [Zootoca vivipara]|uniref:cytoskeleton-associated protein 2 n=1 Tax=Zootoca vivipara TaxID=8524 RepID=UPI001590F503|nr:cytoskeleton-associated protein 2 [Zootoca vivipara]XP_034966610.1 cytoskeleton-associated protein 2 [Zootoca vivipara]XP_034966611.1 cytoskeleton-associated protein 2 [Zootoca vivipara]
MESPENKENAVGPSWTHMDDMLEENLASPKTPIILKQISMAENYSPLASTKTNCSPLAVVFETAKTKSQHMSFNQTSLLKRNGKEKVLKTAAPPIFVPPLSEKRALGSYCGRIVESKINSFRRKPEHENRRNTMAAVPKSAMRTQSTSSITDKKDDRVTSTVNTSKSVAIAKPAAILSLQARPPVKVPVSQPKPILNRGTKTINRTPVNNGASQRNPDRNGELVSANRSVHRTKKNAPTKTRLGPHLTRPVSEVRGAVSALKSDDGVRKHNLAKSAKRIRTRPAERPPLTGLKKLPPPISVDTLPERESFHQTIKEPVESFWSTLQEEDEQGLLSDSVNKTLVKCLHLIEEGYPGDAIHSNLEKLIQSVPDVKKFAKYWVCQMRLEQFRSTEKVLAIYEKAILAGAHPKDELRRTLADVMKKTKTIPASEECVEKVITLNHEAEVHLDEEKIENALKELNINNKMEPGNEVISQRAEACLKSEQESIVVEERQQNKEEKPTVLKKEEQDSGEAEAERILEFPTPETDKEASYLIKYNLSTTPSLKSTNKKMQGDSNHPAIKDLKFLTPVRRSCRIQKKQCQLPDMLKGHDPCVSSLEQLEELGVEGIGFIYRHNSALHKVCTQQGQE